MNVRKNDKFGFTSVDSAEMRKVFCGFPKLKKVLIFGSRARGDFKKGSDVDLAVFADLDTVSSLKAKLEEETKIPYFFDIVDYTTISSRDLKNEIDEFGEVLYEI